MKASAFAVYFTLPLLAFCRIDTARAQSDFWQQTNGPFGGVVWAVAMNASGDIFVGTEGSGVLRSRDNGETWVESNAGLAHLSVRTLAVSPAGHIFAGLDYGGVFRSLDNGGHWQAINNGFDPPYTAGANAFAFKANGEVYAAGFGVYRSTNNGDNWSLMGLTNVYARSLAINSNGDIFAGTDGLGVFRSSNNGATWQPVNGGVLHFADIRALAINANDDLFAGTHSGVYRSTDHGQSWQQLSANLPANIAQSIAIHPNGHIYVGAMTIFSTGGGGVSRSTDNGETWNLTGLTGRAVLAVAVNAEEHIFAGTYYGGLFRSRDEGNNWTMSGVINSDVYTLALDSCGQIFAGTAAGVFRSTERGANWILLDEGLNHPIVHSLAISPAGEVFTGLQVDYGGGVLRFDHYAEKWKGTGFILPYPFDALALGVHPNGLVFVGTNEGVFRSADNGEHWERAGNYISVHTFLFAPDGEIFAATSHDGVYRSRDNGDAWQQSGLREIELRGLVRNRAGHLFAATWGYGVFRSTDNGQSWSARNTGLADRHVSGLAINSNDELFASTYNPDPPRRMGSMFYSKDEGATWTENDSGLPNSYAHTLAVDREGYVYVGFENGGVFRSAQSTTPGRDFPAYLPIAIPMRDNKFLAADLYAEDTTTAKPVILIQTPYNKNFYRNRVGVPEAGGSPFPYDCAHYNYVVVDWRGRFGSRDAAVPGYDLGLDGYDCVEWLAQQRWCNGRVGTWGGSALGQIQFQTARHRPPHLVCAVPMVRDYKTNYEDFYYGGAYRKEHVESLARLGFVVPQTILAHPTRDLFWQLAERNSDYPEEFDVPMLIIGGWYDHFPDEVLRAFRDLQTRSGAAVRDKHKLLFGPWQHGALGKEEQGQLEYPEAVGEHDRAALRFFDFYLRGLSNGYEQEPAVRYFQMGANEWRATNDWFAESGARDTLYLAAQGALSTLPPSTTVAPDSFLYDPGNPAPAIGGARFNPFDPNTPVGPYDQRALVESRSDVLAYSTPRLERDLEIVGAITVRLYVSSNRKDTDFSVRLCDVYPDGRSMLVTDGIHRMRFRNSLGTEELMTPGQVYPVTIALQNLAMTFAAGHRLRILVSSSDYPRFDSNLNNGTALYTPGDTLVASNFVYHEEAYPSRIILPVRTKTSVAAALQNVPLSYHLEQNYPNPFSPLVRGTFGNLSTRIRFTLPRPGKVSLRVIDTTGREVATLLEGARAAGPHSLMWDGKNTASEYVRSGVYFLRLEAGGEVAVRKMAVVR